MDVSPERETWPNCTYPGVCSFQHDVDKVNFTFFALFVNYPRFSKPSFYSIQYLASKQPDLGTECFVFNNYGRCNRGVTCRFAESHIVRDESNCVRNKVDKELADKFGSLKVRELNHLEKELQVDLRKKKYNFDVSDKKVDAFFKMRESEAKNGATTDLPPQKKIKIDEAGNYDDWKSSC